MTLTQQLEQDYIAAYKAKDSVRLNVLRLLKTALKHFQVEHLREPTDDDVLAVIGRQCKQRQDSVEQYKAVGRPELAEQEAAEYAILCAYLPPKLEADELARAVSEAVAATGAVSMKDMGKVMQALNTRHKGRIDGKAASEEARKALRPLG